MSTTKEDFVRSFMPSSIHNFDYTQIDLDITDLSISDVLRNINKLYPPNTKTRMAIEGGEMAIGILCKTETLDPYNGLFLIICGKDVDINIITCNYIVLSISESRIKSELGLEELIEDITRYLIKDYSSEMRNLPDFYRKFVYNESELFEEDDDYSPMGY